MNLRILAFALLLVLASLSFSITPGSVSSCANLTTPNINYFLTANLTGATVSGPNGKVCIEIETSNVSFDCRGLKITNNASYWAGIEIQNSSLIYNVTVMNCNITGYKDGIYANNLENSVFKNNSIQSSSDTGLFLDADFTNATSNTVNNNQYGVFTFGRANIVANNTICGNSWVGFQLHGYYPDNIDNVTFANNTVCNNGHEGVSATLPDNLLIIYSSNNHFYNNNPDVGVYANASMQMNSDIFDNPVGNYQNYTNLSMSDANATQGYTIKWSAVPGSLPSGTTQFIGKFLNISSVAPGEIIDSITWNWLPSELGSYQENMFQIWKYNSSWLQIPCDPEHRYAHPHGLEYEPCQRLRDIPEQPLPRANNISGFILSRRRRFRRSQSGAFRECMRPHKRFECRLRLQRL